MEQNNEVAITTYDRLLRAWENSMELTRDYEMYAKRIEGDEDVETTVSGVCRGRRASRI